MGFTIPDIRKAVAGMTSAGLSDDQSRQIVQYCIKNDNAALRSMIGGDFSALPSVAASLGIGVNTSDGGKLDDVNPVKGSAGKKTEKGTAEKTVKTSAIDHDIKADNIPAARPDQALQTDNAETLPTIDSDNTLPADIADTIQDIITDYMTRFKIDDMRKATAEQWRGACMLIGMYIKDRGLVRDHAAEKKNNNPIQYSIPKLDQLLTLWAYLCSAYSKPTLASDFISFSGVSSTYFNDNAGHELTSSSANFRKKLYALQESGLASGLVDGRKNPTGTIFFLKNWHGWRDQREVVHTTAAAALDASGLPVLGDK